MFASLIATWCLSQTKKTPSTVTTSQTAQVPGPQKVQLRSLSLIGLFLISIFYLFQFPQALLILPLIQRSSVFANFLPSFLIYSLKNLHIFYRALSTVACRKFLDCLVQKNSHRLSCSVFYLVKGSYPLAMNFRLVQALVVFSVNSVFHSAWVWKLQLHWGRAPNFSDHQTWAFLWWIWFQ